MNILFIHRTFPAQFKFLATALAKDSNNLVMFLTANDFHSIEGVQKILYKPKDIPDINPYLKDYAENIAHGQAVAEVAIQMKNKGLIPDIIYGISWGCSLFIKEVFPDVPLICYFEWLTKAEGSAIGFDGDIPDFNYKKTIKLNQTPSLMDLCSCDAGISPTQWQKDQFPKEFHEKIKVLHDGIDTIFCSPDKNAKFLIKAGLHSTTETGSLASASSVGPFVKNIELTAQDEVITYATRGMEPFRGFPQFMEAVAKLQEKRPNAHFVIGGEDAIYYGHKLKEGTYKELILKKYNFDFNRVHFIGGLNFDEYIDMLRISSAHIYLTYPFILSWSILEAMSTGCCIIASNTPPVLEVMKDNYNGLLVDFFDVNQLVEKIEYALDNKDKMQKIRENARKTILDKYALKNLLPKHFDFINDTIKKYREGKR